MRTRMTILVFLACVGTVFSACSDDDDNNAVPGVVENAFNAKYPGASAVEWDKHGDYSEVDFVYQNVETEAWYYKDGTWLLTTSDVLYTSLPETVTTALASGLYSSWTPDNTAEIFEQANTDIRYIVEVSKAGNTDRELYFQADGEMHKEVIADYDRSELPAWMKSFVRKTYPRAYDLQGEEMADQRFTLYIFLDSRMGTIYFFRDQTWDYTTYPIPEADVPAVVLEVLNGEAYEGYQIRSVEYRESAAYNYYYFDLYKAGSLDIKVKIKPNGELVLS